MSDDQINKLRAALEQLKDNLRKNIERMSALAHYLDPDLRWVRCKPKMEEIENLTSITIEIIESDLKGLELDGKDNQNPLNPFHKEALLNHYINVANTLSRALVETDLNKMSKHQENIDELANASKPALKLALHGLAAACSFLAAVFLSSKLLVILAVHYAVFAGPVPGVIFGAAMVPITDKVKAKGYELYREGAKQYHQASVIDSMNKKRKDLSNKNKDKNKKSDHVDIELDSWGGKKGKPPSGGSTNH